MRHRRHAHREQARHADDRDAVTRALCIHAAPPPANRSSALCGPFHPREDGEHLSVSIDEVVVGSADRWPTLGACPQLVANQARPVVLRDGFTAKRPAEAKLIKTGGKQGQIPMVAGPDHVHLQRAVHQDRVDQPASTRSALEALGH